MVNVSVNFIMRYVRALALLNSSIKPAYNVNARNGCKGTKLYSGIETSYIDFIRTRHHSRNQGLVESFCQT